MKNLRYTITALLVLTISVVSQAQKAKMKLANKYYQSYDYKTASEIYRDVLSDARYANDTTAIRRVAESDMKMGLLVSAEGYYRQLMKMNAATREDMHILAENLRLQGKYPEAIEIYTKILTLNPADDIAKRYVEHPDFAHRILRDSSIYTIHNAQVNSGNSDFGASFFTNGKMIFSSARGDDKKDQRLYNRTQQPYLNVYIATINADSTLSGSEMLENKVNSRYHEGTMTYDPRNTTIYINRNNYVRGNVNRTKKGKLNTGIYSAKYDAAEQSWGNIESFPYNNKDYSIMQPALGPGGNRLWFSSDMPGGKGGFDLYFCDRSGESWGSPQNAGSKINTSGNEGFPFLVNDSMLYFSSTGHLGLGGLDLFYTNPYDTAAVKNAGYPANTHFDDFALVCYPDETFGYLSSNRTGGKGDDDIYDFEINPVDTLIVSGNVVDKETLLPLHNALITVPTDDGSVIQVLTDENGHYEIKAPYKKEVTVEGSKQNYIPAQAKGYPDPRSAYLEHVDMKMQKMDYMVTGKVIYADNKAAAVGAMVRLYEIANGDTVIVDSTLIGSTATFMYPLFKDKDFILVATKEEYARQTHTFSTRDPNNKIHSHDFVLFKAKVGEVVRLDNIYYDYKKWDIRPDAAVELNKLVQIMKDNPTMKIELGSHSDARGSDQYNLDLSDKRAKSAAAYIVSQGISADRLYGMGYGEKLILNHCKNDVKCSEEEHQYNRRTEFKITAF